MKLRNKEGVINVSKKDNPLNKYMYSVDFGKLKLISLKEELKAIKKGFLTGEINIK